MKCYTVREASEPGLIIRSIRRDEQAPALLVGEAETSYSAVPVDTNQKAVFCMAAEAAVLPTIPYLRLLRAELADNDPLRFTRERRRCEMALVHVATEAGEDGELWYEANSYDECTAQTPRGERVERFYHPFPGAGTHVVAAGTGPQGEPHALLLMVPGASFRICRTGDLAGASPELVVVWPGSTLRCFAPAKYRPREG